MGRDPETLDDSRSPDPRRLRRIAPGIFVVAAIAGVGWLGGPGLVGRIEAFRLDRMIASGQLFQAKSRLDLEIARHPTLARPRLRLAEVLRKLGRITEAEEFLQRAIELGLPVAEASREQALLSARGSFTAAEPGLRRALAADPRDVEVYRALAEGYLAAARWDVATATCSGWLEIEPDGSDARLARARAYRALDRPELAIADCRAVTRRSPGDIEARLLLAEILIRSRQAPSARFELARCRVLDSDRPEPLILLAACSSAEGDLGGATSILEQVVKQVPNSGPALRALAQVYQARGRDDLAGPLIERAELIDLGPAKP